VPLGAFDHQTGEAFAGARFKNALVGRGGEGGGEGEAGEEILVGAHAGGLYALPRSAGDAGGAGGGGGGLGGAIQVLNPVDP
jgi:hypothetical protein